MATQTTTIYICDRCETIAPVRDLRRFLLRTEKLVGRELVAEAKFDLCADCELQLHGALFPFMHETERAKLEAVAG